MNTPKKTLRALAVGLATTLLAGAASAQEEPRSVAEAQKMEVEDALPPTALYDAPKSLASTKPGALLKQEAFDGYALPKGARAIRILYHSKSADGRDVATSAVVLIPAGTAPPRGWPVIAWAHGTSGVAHQCAPSLMKDVYYGEEGLFPMLRAGYAVVASDYHGLGTVGTHEYINKAAQAYDVVYSIPAARAAAPSLGRRWVVDGHSQGGLAAWGVAELQHPNPDPDYLGAVAVAPGVGLRDLMLGLSRPQAGAGTGFYLDYIAWAIKARTATFTPADMLTGEALARYGDVTSKGCFFYGYASFLHDPRPPVLRPGWEGTPGARRFFAENTLGEAPIAGALLVIASDGDRTVPLDAIRNTVRQACDRRTQLTFRTYRGLDHDPLMQNSTNDQLAWIADRFAGKPASDTCGAGPEPG
jgi:hypothetical protein